MASVNYNDQRFQQVENEKNSELAKTTSTYNEMINNSNDYYQAQIDASKDWSNKQQEIQQANTDFAIEKVDQAKAQAKQDYTKEQKGAYTDYQKATNQYGVNSEIQASQGLQNTGYSESSRTNMYNTYQNRYMAARESYNRAVLNYDNSIKEARLANNSALATIAYEALQNQLSLSLEGFQYKNTLVLQKTEALNQQNDRYYQRYQNVLSQINTENAQAEQIRQYNESLAFQKQQAAQQQANWEKEYALSKAKSYSSSGGGSSSSSAKLTDGSNTSSSSLTSGNTSSGSTSSSYNTALKSARTLYNSARKNKTQAAETILATYVADNKITTNEASKIMKQITGTSSSSSTSNNKSGGGGSTGGR